MSGSPAEKAISGSLGLAACAAVNGSAFQAPCRPPFRWATRAPPLHVAGFAPSDPARSTTPPAAGPVAAPAASHAVQSFNCFTAVNFAWPNEAATPPPKCGETPGSRTRRRSTTMCAWRTNLKASHEANLQLKNLKMTTRSEPLSSRSAREDQLPVRPGARRSARRLGQEPIRLHAARAMAPGEPRLSQGRRTNNQRTCGRHGGTRSRRTP